MSELDNSRRQFLAGAALTLSSLVVTAGLPRVAFAEEAGTRKEMLGEYSPVFFNEREWRCLVAACDRLIPEDDTGPGAIAARVPVFIDRQMQTEYGNGGLWYMQGPFFPESTPQFGYQYKFTPRDIYRIGLRELDAHCRSARSDLFFNLEAAVQDEILHGLEGNTITLPSMPGNIFFSQLLANTKEGFMSDPRYGGNKGMAGWKMIGFPGAQGDYRKAITRHNENLNISPVPISRKEGLNMARTLQAVDAVIVGMGFTGAIVAKELTDAGLKVVVLERGPEHETETTAKAPQVFDELAFDSRGRILQRLNLETVTFRHGPGDRAVPMRRQGAFLLGNGTGGAGFHWSGMHWRALPTDLTHRSTVVERYGEKFIPEGMQIQDFGVTYDDLEPYFTHFEDVCGVSGQAGNVRGEKIAGGNPFEAPRSKEYPQKPLPYAYASALFAKAAAEIGLHPFPAPASNSSGRYTNPYGVEMGQCTLCGFCNDYGCHASAKASPQSTILPVLRTRDNFELRNDSHVTRVNLDSSGTKATGVTYVNSSGEEVVQPAEMVMLTAFQLHNVRLLLLSGIGKPFNYQDGTGVVGRNFCYQFMGGSQVIMPRGTYLNPFASAGAAAACIDDFNGANFDHGPLGFIGGAGIWHNKSGGRPITQSGPIPGSPMWGSAWKKGMVDGYQRMTSVTSHGSVQPYRDVFLDLDPTYRDAYGMPLVRVTLNWHENEFKMSAYTSEQTARIGRAMGAETVTQTNLKSGTPFDTTYYQTTHTTGGAIMGDDPTTSVVNRYLQSWDVPNVFVYGASAFPQNMGYNPTGLVGALAYWSTHHIRENYLKNPGPLVQ